MNLKFPLRHVSCGELPGPALAHPWEPSLGAQTVRFQAAPEHPSIIAPPSQKAERGTDPSDIWKEMSDIRGLSQFTAEYTCEPEGASTNVILVFFPMFKNERFGLPQSPLKILVLISTPKGALRFDSRFQPKLFSTSQCKGFLNT